MLGAGGVWVWWGESLGPPDPRAWCCDTRHCPLPPRPQTPPYLAGGSGREPGSTRSVGDLHVQVIIVDERPGALLLQVWKRSVKVRAGPQRGRSACSWGRRAVVGSSRSGRSRAVRALLAVPGGGSVRRCGCDVGPSLEQLCWLIGVLDAMDPPSGRPGPRQCARCAVTAGVGAQRGAELGGVVRGGAWLPAVALQNSRVALEDLAGGGGCRDGRGAPSGWKW